MPTLAGFLYLAIVLDVFSRRIVGWAMAGHLRTRAYVERRTREGLSKREVMRCLKRYVAREIYRVLTDTSAT